LKFFAKVTEFGIRYRVEPCLGYYSHQPSLRLSYADFTLYDDMGEVGRITLTDIREEIDPKEIVKKLAVTIEVVE
jgi:hypothetical protein